jgi:hypothetical protein
VAIEFEIGFVYQHGCACRAMESRQAADVVDVRVSADDGANFQIIAAAEWPGCGRCRRRIDHNPFASNRIAQNRAVALQHAYRDYFVNEVRGHRPKV